MTVLTIGLLCIAAYGVLVALWLRYDKDRGYVETAKEEGR